MAPNHWPKCISVIEWIQALRKTKTFKKATTKKHLNNSALVYDQLLTEKSVTSPNEQKWSFLPCNRVTHLLILHSTKINISLFTNFALSLVEGITDAPPKLPAILASTKAFVLLVPFSRQVNPCFTPKGVESLQQKCKASTTLGVRTRNKGYEQTKIDAPGFPGAVRKSTAVLWFSFTRPNYSSGVCCNLNHIELPLGLHITDALTGRGRKILSGMRSAMVW